MPTGGVVYFDTGVIELAERYNLAGSVLRATINLSYTLDPDDPVASYRISREGIAKARAEAPAA